VLGLGKEHETELEDGEIGEAARAIALGRGDETREQ
jgi:hypothetical protein